MRRIFLLVLPLCVLFGSGAARAVFPHKYPMYLQWQPPAPQETAAEDGAGSVDEEEEPPPMAPEEARRIQNRLKLRRAVVKIHQPVAIAATASIVFTEVVGIINKNLIQYGNADFTSNPEPYLWIHRIGAGTALTTYLTAGILAWTMPEAYKVRRGAPTTGKRKADSGQIHRALSFAHAAAMGTTIVTGILQANVAKNAQWEPLVTVHTVAGFTSAALVLTAAIVIGTF